MRTTMIIVGGLILALYFLTTGYSLGYQPAPAIEFATVTTVADSAQVESEPVLNYSGQIIPDRDEFIVSAEVVDDTGICVGLAMIPAFEDAIVTSDCFLPEGTIVYWDEMARLTHSLGIVVDNMQPTNLTGPYYPDEYNGDNYTPFTFRWFKTSWPPNPVAEVFLSSHIGNSNPPSIVKIARWGLDEYTELGYSMATKWGNEMALLSHNANGFWVQREAAWECDE